MAEQDVAQSDTEMQKFQLLLGYVSDVNSEVQKFKVRKMDNLEDFIWADALSTKLARISQLANQLKCPSAAESGKEEEREEESIGRKEDSEMKMKEEEIEKRLKAKNREMQARRKKDGEGPKARPRLDRGVPSSDRGPSVKPAPPPDVDRGRGRSRSNSVSAERANRGGFRNDRKSRERRSGSSVTATSPETSPKRVSAPDDAPFEIYTNADIDDETGRWDEKESDDVFYDRSEDAGRNQRQSKSNRDQRSRSSSGHRRSSSPRRSTSRSTDASHRSSSWDKSPPRKRQSSRATKRGKRSPSASPELTGKKRQPVGTSDEARGAFRAKRIRSDVRCPPRNDRRSGSPNHRPSKSTSSAHKIPSSTVRAGRALLKRSYNSVHNNGNRGGGNSARGNYANRGQYSSSKNGRGLLNTPRGNKSMMGQGDMMGQGFMRGGGGHGGQYNNHNSFNNMNNSSYRPGDGNNFYRNHSPSQRNNNFHNNSNGSFNRGNMGQRSRGMRGNYHNSGMRPAMGHMNNQRGERNNYGNQSGGNFGRGGYSRGRGRGGGGGGGTGGPRRSDDYDHDFHPPSGY